MIIQEDLFPIDSIENHFCKILFKTKEKLQA